MQSDDDIMQHQAEQDADDFKLQIIQYKVSFYF